ncbi:SUMF1/EgtB/PvdO family nonheme iron enzyme [Actinomadura sp. LOL_016]|uniref:SUMF1/EgtB/PvdO family nonheme iron enzyme n=1 Tax=Actinomadura sp. LOL_016 TaxID=3345411 RepID=UPI003A87C1F4
MTTTVQRWTGREIRALREAKRMSIRDFAGHLGVSERMVSKWEAGGEDITPRPVNQSALDSSLAASDAEAHARFVDMLGLTLPAPTTQETSMSEEPTPGATDEDMIPVGDENQVRHPVDGKLMTLVEAGVFFAGTDNEPVYVPAFYMDVFPTTNADYSRFLTATNHKPPQHWENSKPPIDQLDHPVVFVTWHDATAYAQWSAKALPTSQQWEKAARGTRGDIYPWGSQRTPAKCNCREHGIRRTTPVDRYASGVSPYGIYDMCGNTWEWCSTETEPGRYELKGSAFTSPFLRCTPSTFNDASADMWDDDTSFRTVTPAETMRALLNMQR